MKHFLCLTSLLLFAVASSQMATAKTPDPQPAHQAGDEALKLNVMIHLLDLITEEMILERS